MTRRGWWDDAPRPIVGEDWKGEPTEPWRVTGLVLAAVLALCGLGVWAVLAFLVERS